MVYLKKSLGEQTDCTVRKGAGTEYIMVLFSRVIGLTLKPLNLFTDVTILILQPYLLV
jgi:hypothetical protein